MIRSHGSRPMIFVLVDDMDSSLSFYEGLLAMPLKFRDGDQFAALDGDGVTLALVNEFDHPAEGQTTLGFKCDDIEALADQLGSSGFDIGPGIRDGGHERRLVARDPSGSPVLFYQPASSGRS